MKTPPFAKTSTARAARATGRGVQARQKMQADRQRLDETMTQVAHLRRYGYATEAQLEKAATVYAAARVAMAAKGART